MRRAIGFITASLKTYSSCGQYKENVADARRAIVARGLADVEVVFVDDWHMRSGFIAANAVHVADALRRLPAERRAGAVVMFTAHSIPKQMAEQSRYRENLWDAARAVMELVGSYEWAFAYQSRSGRPEDPWLGPDVNEALRHEHAEGLRAVVLCPIGFLCDHVEVLWDLDREAMETCRELGIVATRAKAVNDDAHFIELMADVVCATYARHAEHRRLPIVPGGDR